MNKKGEVAVVAQRNNVWSLPKGMLEPGEDESTALRRELWEETGIAEYNVVRKLGSYERYLIGLDGQDDKSELKNITFYLITTEQEKLESHDTDNPEARWVDKNEVAAMLTHPKDKEFFESVVSEI